MSPQGSSGLDRPEAKKLRQGMSDAYDAVRKAQHNYENTLTRCVDSVPATPLTLDSIIAVRQQGQEYARAVTLYSHAVMEWLAFVDKTLSGK